MDPSMLSPAHYSQLRFNLNTNSPEFTTYTTKHSLQKPFPSNSSYLTLLAIDKVIKDNLSLYDPETGSNLQPNILQLIRIAEHVYKGYDCKVRSKHLLSQLIIQSSSKHLRITLLYQNITRKNFIEMLPNETIQNILKFLDLKDLQSISRVNQSLHKNYQHALHDYAKQCGYRGNSFKGEETFLKKHIKHLKFFIKRDDLSKKYLSKEKNTTEWGKTLRTLVMGHQDLKIEELNSALLKYAEKNKPHLLETLILLGADIEAMNTQNQTPLMLAAYQGIAQNVSFLLQKGANCNASSKGYSTPLAFAMKSSRPYKISKLILEQDSSTIDQVCSLGLAPLHIAVQSKDFALINLLLEHKASIDVYDQYGFTPLIQSIMQESNHITEHLIEKGAKTDFPSRNNSYPIAFAVGYANSYKMTKLILEKNGRSTIDFLTSSGETPLHLAARNGLEKITRLLLDNGANKSVINSNGKTPFEVARTSQIKRMLQ